MLWSAENGSPCVQVVTLDLGLLVAGTKYRGEFEERLKKLMEEIKQNDDIILVRLCPPISPFTTTFSNDTLSHLHCIESLQD